MVEGMPQQPIDDIENQYAMQNVNVRYVPSKIDMKWGFWRSIGASEQICPGGFMDEIAQNSAD